MRWQASLAAGRGDSANGGKDAAGIFVVAGTAADAAGVR